MMWTVMIALSCVVMAFVLGIIGYLIQRSINRGDKRWDDIVLRVDHTNDQLTKIHGAVSAQNVKYEVLLDKITTTAVALSEMQKDIKHHDRMIARIANELNIKTD